MPRRTLTPPDAPAGKTDWARLAAMTDEEAEAAALADPDASPQPEGRPMHRFAVAKRIRLLNGLTREAFAERFHLPLDIVTAWERYEVEPDAVARAFLTAIENDPEGVAAALARPSVAAE